MQDRLRGIIAGSDSEITEQARFRLLTPDMQDAAMPNLATQEGQEGIGPFVADRDFIVVDNLACLANHGRSNEEESWRPLQDWLLDMRRQGKTVLIVHHQGKNGDQRGTSAKEDILDTVISLVRPKDYKPCQGARVEVYYTKARHFTGKDAMPFEAILKSENGGNLTWSTRTLEDVELKRFQELRDAGFSIRDAAR